MEAKLIDCRKLIKQGICKGDCCGCVTFPKDILANNVKKFQASVEDWKVEGDVGAIITKDMRCIFLRKDYSCAIYEERPDVCRMFGSGKDEDGKENVLLYCPHAKPNGNQWSPAKKKHLQRRIKQVTKETMKKMEERT